MLKKLITLIVSVLLVLGTVGSACAALADLELLRVVYERTTGTTEQITDLGPVGTVLTGTHTIAGDALTATKANNLFVSYMAINKTTGELWVSNSTTIAPIAVGTAGFNSTKTGFNSVYYYYNTVLTADANGVWTGSQSYPNSFKSKLDASQGSLANGIDIATRTTTEASLASLVGNPGAAPVVQILYYFLNANTGGSTGVPVATITTLANGSTVISPPPAPTAPDKPTGVAATEGNTKATATFIAPASNGGSIITGYTVSSIPADGADSNAGTTSLSHVITGLTNGTSYTFTVIATNGIGDSLPSDPSSAVTPAATAPDMPTGATATPGNAEATVSFTAPASNGGSAILNYTVTSNDGISATGPASPITVTGLTNGTTYTFTVTATTAIGTSAASDPSAAVTPAATVPDKPTGATATPGNAEATVSFTAPASNGGSTIQGYKVTSDDGITATGLGSPITVTGLTNGTSYTFTVVATNGIGPSIPSVPSTKVTPATVPDAPPAIIATAGNASAEVMFDAPAANGGSPITGYTVTSSPTDGTDIDAGTLAIPHAISGLTNGRQYTFTVTATNGKGTGPTSVKSNPVTPSTAATAPSAPRDIATTAGNANGEAWITFTAPANGGSPITGYTVVSSPSGGTDTTTDTTVLKHVITGLSNGTKYTFSVTATNSTGTSLAGKSGFFTPIGAPYAPTSVTASAGNAQASVMFFAPRDSGSPITGYTVTSIPEGRTVTGPASPITVTGLTNGKDYTFTVTANSGIGNGPASTPSNNIIPTGAPNAPTIGTATAGDAEATVTFSAPASNGGNAITGYTVTSTPGGLTGTGTASPIAITGLANGTSYTFTVTATNSFGPSASSAQSNSVVPSISPLKFTVTPTTSDANGSVSPATSQTLNASSTTSFSLIPKAGYQVATVTGCGGALSGTTYTTAGIIRDCTVTATFVATPPLKGDLNGDGKVDIADALLALEFAIRLRTPSAADIAAGDVAPILGGKSTPDGKIDIADAVAILQKTVGLMTW